MRARAEAGFAGAAAVLASVGAVVFLELWDADLRVPFAYSGDATLNLMLIKDAMERTWFYANPELGAPGKQLLYDYPVLSGDALPVAFFRVAGLFTDNAGLVMNLFFLVGFPLTAAVAYLVLRQLGVGRDVALVVAVLYTLLPYHFMRGEVHLFLAAYWVVPLGALLALAVLNGRLRIGLVAAGLAALVALASGSFYYSAFTVLLVAVAALLRLAATREWRALLPGVFVVAVLLAVSLAQLGPTIAYRVRHGTNDEVAKRYWFESENYALKITQLVLPVDGHRIDRLARRKAEYTEQIPPNEGRTATLGIVGTVGFFWLLGVGVAALAGAVRRPSLEVDRRLAALTLVSVLVATTGGLSTLIAVAWPQIRSWNRLSVFIAFFCLAAVAVLLERLRPRLPRLVFGALLAAILVLGALDQTTSQFVPPYGQVEAEYASDGRWFGSLESRLAERAAVVELPYEPFPEPAGGGLRPLYEPAKGYVHSNDLRWSWGAMRGRPDDWAAQFATKPAAELIPAARQAGFAGVLVDRLAYPDQGAQATAELTSVVGSQPEASPNGRYAFWPLEGK